MTSWIIPCNMRHFDIISAFSEMKNLEWRQSTNISVGDDIYIYVGSPVKCILYKCQAKRVNISPDHLRIDDSKFERGSSSNPNPAKRYMEIELQHAFKPFELSLSKLRENGLKSCMQGPCILYDPLKEFVESHLEDPLLSR